MIRIWFVSRHKSDSWYKNGIHLCDDTVIWNKWQRMHAHVLYLCAWRGHPGRALGTGCGWGSAPPLLPRCIPSAGCQLPPCHLGAAIWTSHLRPGPHPPPHRPRPACNCQWITQSIRLSESWTIILLYNIIVRNGLPSNPCADPLHGLVGFNESNRLFL